MNKRIIFLILGVSYLFPFHLRGEVKEVYSLKKILNKVLTDNLVLKENYYNLLSKKNQIEQAKSLYYPSLDLVLGYQKNQNQIQNETPITTGNYYAGINLSQNIYDSGRTSNFVKSKEILYEISDLQIQKIKEDIIFDLIHFYFDLLVKEEKFKFSLENKKYYEYYLELTSKLIQQGLRPEYEKLKIQSQLKAAEVEVVKDKNQLLISKYKLLLIMGDVEKSLKIDEKLENFQIEKIDIENPQNFFKEFYGIFPYIEDDFSNFNKLIEIAFLKRKDYLIQKQQIQFAKMNKELNQSEYYPKLKASATYNWYDDYFRFRSIDRRNWNVNIYFQFPIFNGFGTQQKVEESLNLLKSEEEKEKYLKENIILNIRQNILNYNESLETMALYLKSYLYAKENLTLAQKRYINGLGTFLELSDATSQYYQSYNNYLQSIFSTQINKLKILYSIGVILEIL